MQGNSLLLLPAVIPIAAGAAALFIKAFDGRRAIRALTLAALILCAGAVACIAAAPETRLTIWEITPEVPIVLISDTMAKLFISLTAGVWLLVGLFAFEYMKHEENERRFFGFYLISLGVIIALGMSGNMVTLYMFYELMTLAALPLVMHTRTREAVAAGMKFFVYSIAGALMSLLGMFFISSAIGSFEFVPGGYARVLLGGSPGLFLTGVFLMIIGFGTKAGMFPMHGWLSAAHPVAPAPASAVLSGIITKCGVLGIVRVVLYTVDAAELRGTWVQWTWMTLAIVTILMGSVLAFKEQLIKKRLAYSTVSQVSYVMLGLSTLTAAGVSGALSHVVFHSIMKNALFMAAGAFICLTGYTRVNQLKGVGRRLPEVTWGFTIAALSLIGIPPLCGFISKWMLATGSMQLAGTQFAWAGPAALIISALFTAAYLMPITVNGFFPGGDGPAGEIARERTPALMFVPLFVLAALTVVFGVFPQLITGITGAIGAIIN